MPTMINTMTLLLVVLHFLRASVAPAPTDDDYRTESILAIEDICMCVHAIIDRVGAPIHLQSLYTLWSACSKALAILETELFPGCEPSIPSEITMPATPLKLTTLKQQTWAQHRTLITALQSLVWHLLWFAVAPRQSWHFEWLVVASRVCRRHLWHTHSTTYCRWSRL